jgi:hypothetical protein
MTYTFLSAQYANAERTAAIADTEEAASVMLNAVDTPEDWAALLAWGEPAAYVPPAPPSEPTKAELLAQLQALYAKIEALP